MGDMAEWINDDAPWDGVGPDPEERDLMELRAEIERLRARMTLADGLARDYAANDPDLYGSAMKQIRQALTDRE